jgi:hypothetical protein
MHIDSFREVRKKLWVPGTRVSNSPPAINRQKLQECQENVKNRATIQAVASPFFDPLALPLRRDALALLLFLALFLFQTYLSLWPIE